MKRKGIIILALFFGIMASAIVFLLFYMEINSRNTTKSQDISVSDPAGQQSYLDVNEVLTNYEQYVNKKIVIGGVVKTRGGDSFNISDITGSEAPKWADSITVETYFKTDTPDYFTPGDTVLVSGSYSGVMYNKDTIEFFIMADEIKLLN